MRRAALGVVAALAAISLPATASAARLIAFASDRDGDSDIYLMRADGTDLRKLTRNRASDSQPTWSPDGSRIVFVSDRDGDEELHVMRPTGATSGGSLATRPATSFRPGRPMVGWHARARSEAASTSTRSA
jgi:dipeptidyl aminopeptidase/acylaminoacyl peptidase